MPPQLLRLQDENVKKAEASDGLSASKLISNKIADLGDWRGKTLSAMRKLIKEADPKVVEEWKWMGTPVWSHDGIICTGESYKKVVKLTFAKGASLKDPAGLFNSSLDGKVRRAIDIAEGEKVNKPAFKALIREAVALNSRKVSLLVIGFCLSALGACVMGGTSSSSGDTVLGSWGGAHVGLLVTADSGIITYDCAHGSLNAPIRSDGSGNFDVGGVHVREHGGPVRIDEVPNAVPARYRGQINGDRMELRVLMASDTLGPFTLKRGRTPQLVRCL